jgi:hypothetical protein
MWPVLTTVENGVVNEMVKTSSITSSVETWALFQEEDFQAHGDVSGISYFKLSTQFKFNAQDLADEDVGSVERSVGVSRFGLSKVKYIS